MLGDLFYRGADPEILIFPKLTASGESTCRGVYLAGDASGKSLLKNSLNSGAEITEQIAKKLKGRALKDNTFHLAIIGAGPAGLAAASRAKKLGLSFVIIEQSIPARTIENFHKHKPVFAEPAATENISDLWFEECTKEELLDKWKTQLTASAIKINTGETLEDIRDYADLKEVITNKNKYRAMAVILATGKSGSARRLDIPGEDLPHVHTALSDPDYYSQLEVAVVGAGDSAAETAIALAESNKVHLIVRRNKIDRPQKRNRDRLFACERAGKVEIHYNSKPLEITAAELRLDSDKGSRTIKADHVFLALGNDLPLAMFRKFGIYLENDWNPARLLKLVLFSLLVLFFYLWKNNMLAGYLLPQSWGEQSGDGLGLYGWTHQISEYLHLLPTGPSIWAGAVYTAVVTGFGLRCIYKYRKDAMQVRRYCFIIFSQAMLLWLIPEVFFQGVLKLADGWRSYGLVIPAPLYVWNFKSPLGANLFWLFWFMLYSFVGVPLIARFTGKKFCSYFCGCGCLSETLGDPWRKLAPRGKKSRAREKFGQWSILALVCMLVTFGIIRQDSSVWDVQKFFIDFFLASLVGVATYPFWGGRIWCRFFCPLARVLHFTAGNTSDIKISSGTHCIECGLCSKYCQMGIPVMEFAKNSESFDNTNSSCIQCGICITACPVRNLQNGEWDEELWKDTVNNGALTVME